MFSLWILQRIIELVPRLHLPQETSSAVVTESCWSHQHNSMETVFVLQTIQPTNQSQQEEHGVDCFRTRSGRTTLQDVSQCLLQFSRKKGRLSHHSTKRSTGQTISGPLSFLGEFMTWSAYCYGLQKFAGLESKSMDRVVESQHKRSILSHKTDSS